MLKIFCALLNIGAFVCSFAQTTIEGNIHDEKNSPIEFVTVLLRTPHDSTLISGTTTDATGRYAFAPVVPGKYLLTATFVGYHAHSTSIELQAATAQHLVPSITLKENAQVLSEVVVRGQKPLIEQEGDKLILNVQNSVVAAGGNVADLLSRVPGVSVDQNDQVSLNGKTGVTIMIDGKITYLPPAELATLLRSMNANNIATVEVMTNPSSRYDATGNSGMINIRMKKNSSEGFYGSATIGAGYGRYGKANGNVNLSYRKKKWAHFLNYGRNYEKRFYYADAIRISGGDQAINFAQVIDRVQKLPSQKWQAGSEWQWNAKNTIVVNTTGSYNQRLTDNVSFLEIGPVSASAPDSTFRIDNVQQYQWHNVSGSMGYKHIFDRAGSKLSIDVDHSRYGFRLNDNFNISRFESGNVYKDQYNVLSNQPSSFHIYAARADYTHRLNEHLSLETGIKYSYVRTVNDINFTNNINGQYEADTIRSSDFNYAEQIGAGYVNMKTTLFGLATQLGLRAEQTNYSGFSVKANKAIERSYFRVFPGFSLSKNVTENYQLGLSYSYRIDRPTYKDLYPYVYYFDPFDSQFGNPGLLPQFTHNIQVSQTIAKDFVVNLGYSSISQYMNFAILLYEDQVSSYAIKKNFDRFENFYLTVVAPTKVTRQWTMNCNLNLFYNNFNTQFLDEIYAARRLSGIANISNTITLPWGVTAEITGVYNSRALLGLLQTRGFGSLNAGLQKQFLDKKATLRLSITDIFQTNRIGNIFVYPGLDMDIHVRNETRVVRLNFTYTMGKSTGKVLRKRNTLEEEQKRVGG